MALQHLACIMDGNRRWARQKGWLPWDGHQEGVKAATRVMDFCLKKHIPYLTLYTLSLENLNRSSKEVSVLFSLLQRVIKQEHKKVQGEGVRVLFVGDRSRFPTSLQETIYAIEQSTAHNTTLTVQVLFCYGGRTEIAAAAKEIARKVQQGLLACENISEETIAQHLWTHGCPEPELLIRTGKEKRLSNFLPYQTVYTELYFLDILWPDITDSELEKAYTYFSASKRNFGV